MIPRSYGIGRRSRFTVLALLWLPLLTGDPSSRAEAPRAVEPSDSEAAPPARKTPGPGKITIGRDTTFVTGPLADDGFVDYERALNERARRGVTPENNAAALLWQAVGPTAVYEDRRDAFFGSADFQSLGIPRPAEQGDYFVTLRDHVAKVAPDMESRVDELLQKATEGTLPSEDKPLLEQWLKQNEAPLALVAKAARRPRFYSPIELWGPRDCEALPGSEYCYRNRLMDRLVEIATTLTVRAMLRLDKEQGEAAWDDLVTCRRLARLIEKGPTHTHLSGALRIERDALAAMQTTVYRGEFSVESLRRHLRELDKMPPRPNVVDQIDYGARFAYLNTISSFPRYRLNVFRFMGGAPLIRLSNLRYLFNGESNRFELARAFETIDQLLKCYTRSWPLLLLLNEDVAPYYYGAWAKVMLFTADWNAMLRDGNTWFDRYAEAWRNASPKARDKEIAELRDRFDEEIRTARRRVRPVRDSLLSTEATSWLQQQLWLAKDRFRDDRAVLHLLDTLSDRVDNNLVADLEDSVISSADRWKTALLVWMRYPIAIADVLQHICMDEHASSVAYCDVWVNRMLTHYRLTRIALALQMYHAEHRSQYPKQLDDLKPKYLAEVPGEVFAEGPFRYYPSERKPMLAGYVPESYLLYSVGWNKKDEGGYSYDPDFGGDDIAVNVPHKPRKVEDKEQ